MNEKLTQDQLKELLRYNSDTGVFRWRVGRQGTNGIGSVAGGKDREGYIVIGIFKKVYRAHRLAWLYEKGYLPENDLDHIDRIKHHNWINNLREVSRQCNLRNRGNSKNNKSGIKGVYLSKKTNKWIAYITIDGSTKYIGCYNRFYNAVCGRLAVEQCLGWEGCDSLSPAYKYVKINIIR